MKRREVIRHLEESGCEFLREGGNHTVYVNRAKRKASAVPRHREINTARDAEETHWIWIAGI